MTYLFNGKSISRQQQRFVTTPTPSLLLFVLCVEVCFVLMLINSIRLVKHWPKREKTTLRVRRFLAPWPATLAMKDLEYRKTQVHTPTQHEKESYVFFFGWCSCLCSCCFLSSSSSLLWLLEAPNFWSSGRPQSIVCGKESPSHNDHLSRSC